MTDPDEQYDALANSANVLSSPLWRAESGVTACVDSRLNNVGSIGDAEATRANTNSESRASSIEVDVWSDVAGLRRCGRQRGRLAGLKAGGEGAGGATIARGRGGDCKDHKSPPFTRANSQLIQLNGRDESSQEA